MAGYSAFPRSIFNEPQFRSLSEKGKLLTCFAIGGPHANCAGAFLLPDAHIGDAFDWRSKTVPETVREASTAGYVTRFADGRHMAIPRHWEWNSVANPNVMKAAIKTLRELPPDPVLAPIINGLDRFSKQFKTDFEGDLLSLRQRLLEPFRNTTSTSTATSSLSNARGEEPIGWQQVWEEFVSLPGFSHHADEGMARQVWERRGSDFPSAQTMVRCIKAYGRSVTAANSKRPHKAGLVFLPKPSNWLERDMVWKNFLFEGGGEANAVEIKCPALVEACGDRFPQLLEDIGGADVFNGWLSSCEFELDPPKLIAEKVFQAKWIRDHFLRHLQRALGRKDVQITTAVKVAA